MLIAHTGYIENTCLLFIYIFSKPFVGVTNIFEILIQCPVVYFC